MRGIALQLSLHRHNRTLGGRLGWIAGIGVAVLFASAAMEGRQVTLDAVRVLCWAAAGPAALAAARAPSDRDRADGIELLAGIRGIEVSAWRRVRVVAAAVGCALRIVVPALVVAATVLIVNATGAAAWRASGALVGGLVAGLVIGGIAALCGEVGGARGRTLFAAVVLLPWLLGDVWSAPTLSLVGALDAGLSMLSNALGSVASWS